MLIVLFFLIGLFVWSVSKEIPKKTPEKIPHCEIKYYNPRVDYANRQDTLRKLLFEFDDICRHNDIQYWLIEGPLLGQYRTGTLIPWDEDLDVGMFRKDFEKLCQVSLDRHEMRRWSHNTSGRFIDQSNGMFIDIQIFWRKDDGWSCRWDTHKKYITKIERPLWGVWPDKTLFPLSGCMLEGRQFLCPRDTEAYLTTRYHDLDPDHYWDGHRWCKKPRNIPE